jgi:cell division septation protein DedD
MSTVHEPSYYEVALTNRQVVTGFVVLLLSLVLVFFAGVWVGRTAPMVATGEAVTEEPEPAAEVARQMEEQQAKLERFEFFTEPSDEQPAGDEGAETAPPAGPSVTPPQPEALVIQVFSSPDEPQARKLVTQLQAEGFPAFLSPVEVESREMYRVRIGPFRRRAAAERVASRVKERFALDTWITPQ